MEKLNLYFDMDNTLALFSPKEQDEKLILEQMFEVGFFRNLAPLDNCTSVLPMVAENLKNKVEMFILSACIDTPHCRTEKLEWLQEHLPFIKKENIIFTKVGENKTDYITTTPNTSILFDDYSTNLKQWVAWGGVAIKKRSSEKGCYDLVVRDWGDIGTVLRKLGL